MHTFWSISPYQRHLSRIKIHLSLLTYIDDGICLYVLHVFVMKAELLAAPVDRADDTRCHSVAQLERAPHGNDKLTGTRLGRVSKLDGWQIFLRTRNTSLYSNY